MYNRVGPYTLPTNRTEFSDTFAITDGAEPAYHPLTIPSFFKVWIKQSDIPLYRVGKVCILTLTVSNGWLTYTSAIPPNYDQSTHYETIK